jgi:glucosamine--fructose-6-phosphate aminotransferase (isomerizing)
MCGIVGIVSSGASRSLPAKTLKSLFNRLLHLSEARGKEASGVAIRTGNTIRVHKQATPVSGLIASRRYRDLMAEQFANYPDNIALIGHSRLVTNGVESEGSNNQPVCREGAVGIHNGIIVNCEQLFSEHPEISRQLEVDTEVILCLLRHYTLEARGLEWAAQQTYRQLRGVASIAVLSEDSDQLLLATNNGSLYLCVCPELNLTFFASEEFILMEAIRKEKLAGLLGEHRLEHLQANRAASVGLAEGLPRYFSLQGQGIKAELAVGAGKVQRRGKAIPPMAPEWFQQEFRRNEHAVAQLRRCATCVHPETLPFVGLDENGICTYCRNHRPLTFKGRDSLEQLMQRHRRGDGRADCIIPLSGGRDSCYSLHLLAKEMGMKPLTYTYDWGMVTDLARRNCSRMCSELGIEHIIISADIKRKRRYIRKNVTAWLKKPDLGTVPLFMAGDKGFHYYAGQLRRRTGIELLIMAANPLEQTDFKHGFCGITGGGVGDMHWRLGGLKNLEIALYYAKEFLANPAYINESILDTLFAYVVFFLMPHRYTSPYDYVPWVEETVVDTIRREYDWEIDPGTSSTWRIGDGTACFYNYIYYTVAGFSENDTFRSFQVREGHLTREEALLRLEEDNQPRYDSLSWYCRTVGVDLESCLKTIHAIPKLYHA